MTTFYSQIKRRGTMLAGVFSLAITSLLLLCGAGTVPVQNFVPQGAMQADLNAGGHNLTNAATISATNVIVSGSLTAPGSFTLPFSRLTGTPTTLSGYGITDPLVLTSGSYANPAWITSVAYSKLSGAPTLGALASATPAGTPSSTTFLKYDGTNFSYAVPAAGSITTGTALLYGNGSGGFSNATVGGGLAFSSGTLSANVTTVAGRTGAVTLSASDVAGLAAVATSGSYADLSSKPTVPTLVSQLSNDSGFLTATGNGSQLTNINGYGATLATITATGTTTLSRLGNNSYQVITLGAGSGAYTASVPIQDVGVQGGDTYDVTVNWPTSTNPTLSFYDSSTGGTLLRTFAGTTAGGTVTYTFKNTGTAWTIALKGDLPTRSLGSGVQAATTNPLNAASALVGTDANGNIPLSNTSVNYPANKQSLIFIGDSIVAGATLGSALTQAYPYLVANLPWVLNHATVYNFGSGGAILAAAYNQGSTIAVTATTQNATWSGATNTITLSAANANIVAGDFVYVTGTETTPTGQVVPYGTRVTSVSGTTVVLNPAAGYTTGTIASGSAVNLTFIANNVSDIYDKFVHPLRPALTGISRGYVFIGCGTNDCGSNTVWGTYAAMTTNLGLVEAKCVADGFIPVPVTITSRSTPGSLNWSLAKEQIRNQVNDYERIGPYPPVDAALRITANAASPDYLGNDGLHWNSNAHFIMANLVNNFLQAGGGMNTQIPRTYDTIHGESGIEAGPVGAGWFSNNLSNIYDSNLQGVLVTGKSIFSGQTPSAGWGSALINEGSEERMVFTPTVGTAGQSFTVANGSGTPLLSAFKFQPGGVMAGGSNVSSLPGDSTGGMWTLNGNNGTLTTSRLTVPASVSVTPTGTTGSTGYSYSVVAVAFDGTTLSDPVTVTTSTGNATLSGSNYNLVGWTGVPNAAAYKVYRAASSGSPSTLGLLTTISNVIDGLTGSYADKGTAVTGSVPIAGTPGQGAATMTGYAYAPTVLTGAATLAINNSYIWNGSSNATLTLPATCPVGARIVILGNGAAAGLATVSKATGQSIYFGTGTTYSTVAQGASANCLTLSCTVANTQWTVETSTGTFTNTP